MEEQLEQQQIQAQPEQQIKEQMPKKKSKFPVLILGIIFVLLVGAGGAYYFLKIRQPKKEITLTYWGLWEPEPVMNGIISQWEKDHPSIKIRYVKQDKEDYRARLQSAFSRSEGPDIFRFHQTWVPMLKDDLAPVPQTTATEIGLEENYFSIVKDSLSQNGQYYGVPLMIDSLALYYNKDLLTAANLSPPRTWWGLEEVAKKLTVRPQERITTGGVAMGTTSNVDHWSDIIGLMIYQNGGDPAEPDALVEDVLKYYLKFKTINQVWDETMPNSTTAFANGSLAFYFGPSWRVFNIKEANPGLNFGITAVPQLPKLADVDWEKAEAGEAELTDIGWSTFWVEGVWNKSKNQEEAWQFLSFLSSKETMQKLYTAQSQLRQFGEIYPRKDLASQINDPLVKPFVEEIKTAKTWYLCSYTRDAGINDRMINYYQNAINELSESGSSEKVLTDLKNGVDQVLSQYGLAD
jgi:multiple sugar transport system substrate-binding protein